MSKSFLDKNLPDMQRVDYFKLSLLSYEPRIKTNLNIYEYPLKYDTKNESKKMKVKCVSVNSFMTEAVII